MNQILRSIFRQFIPASQKEKLRYLCKPRNFAILENPQYNDDGLATRHVPVFLKDARFSKSYEAGKNTGALDGLQFQIEWRAHVACWCATQALKLEGDFVECGVGRGLLTKTIATFTQFQKFHDRKFYLVDTYEGLAKEHMSSSEQERNIVDRMKDIYKNNFERVSHTFQEFPNITLVKGTVPSALALVPASKVAYLSIDMNNAKPEIEAAKYFWPKLAKGGMILLDDFVYGVEFHEQTEAFLNFAKEVGHEILVLPTGQGLLIKQN